MISKEEGMVNPKISYSSVISSYNPSKFLFVNENKNYLRKIEEIEEQDKQIE
jgi:hypothetical protein